MSIRIVYPNPFTGLAAFAGGATEAYNAGRIQSQTQEAQARYQNQVLREQQNAQIFDAVGRSVGQIGSVAIAAPYLNGGFGGYQTPGTIEPTPTFPPNEVGGGSIPTPDGPRVFEPGQLRSGFPSDFPAGGSPGMNYPTSGGLSPEALLSGTGNIPSSGPGGFSDSAIRGAIASAILNQYVPGIGQIGQIPLQQQVSDANASRAFQYDQAAAQADYGRRQQFFDYTRAARNEDQFFETFGATPSQSQDIGRAHYQSVPPAQQQQMAQFYGYSPSQIGSLPQADQDRFYGSIGIRQLQSERAQQEIDNRVQMQRVISGEKGFQGFAQGLEAGTYDLHPLYKAEYSALQQKNAEIAKQMNNGDITREQGMAALQENGAAMDSFLRTTPEWARIKPSPTPQQQFDKSIVTDKKTGKRMIASVSRSGVTWKPLDDNKEEKSVPNFKSAEEAQQWFNTRTFEVTTPDGKKVKKYLNPNGGLVDIESKDDPLPKPPTLSDVTREMADMVQFLMAPRTVTNADGEKTVIPAMKYDEAVKTAKTMLADSAEVYGAFASRSAALPYAIRDTKESIEGARQYENFRAMSQKFLSSVPPALRPELARQLALEMGRNEPVQPNSVFMGGGQQGPPPPQPRPTTDRAALESEARAILQKYPVPSEAPQEVRDRIAQIKQQLQGR